MGIRLTGRRLLLAGILLLAAFAAAHAGQRARARPSGAARSTVRAAARRSVPGNDWTRFGYDAQRSGVGPADTGITAANVRSLRLRTVHLDGTVDAAPVELHAVTVRGRRHDVIILTTTYGRTIALDAGTGGRLWEYTPPGIGGYSGSYEVTTATPVIDPDRRYVYAPSPDGLIHKLAIATGREVRAGHWPVRITFLPSREKITAALNVSGSSVVATTGGYLGDAPPYQGHLVMIDRASGRITHVFNTLCSNRPNLIGAPSSCPVSDSAIVSRAGAVIEPGSGRILIATGNAPFNGSTDWGDSVLELSRDGGRLLGHWTPTDQAELNDTDTDLGSSSPALLPGGLAVQGGKDGILHLIDVNRLEGTGRSAGSRLGGELQDLAGPGSAQVFTQPVVWTRGARTSVFVADTGGTAAYVLGGDRRLHRAWSTGTAGTSPVLAGGLLYVFDPDGGRLDVYDPVTGRLRASLPAAPGHWNSPIVAGGRVILPVGSYLTHATSGTLELYHLPGR
ncbi:MAG: PQQ-binding-like beta-propeller repeat protein [Solirubrobacterales bacterium]|nr:PQQ-binding-like beta-propeller repeat protein [Solirubrobacterales bacterium]MBV9714405.1 PQQ-binding-like beta-propeller repeat protein [Solirubrobacterales bacterium]